ncbi:type II toxin-antitoxin system HicA family toxin [bacterium]|nr:MAG: type II toxin-antitoxin system HicA family toxin [bacterium]
MKRIDFLKFITRQGCVFLREGAKHSVYFNPITNRSSTIPRHNEIDNFLVKKISNDLGIPKP